MRKVIAFLMASLLASWLVPIDAFAHGEPAQLAFWGNFGPGIAHCQRAIGHAASNCGTESLHVRNHCSLDRLRGGDCDDDDIEAQIQAIRAIARLTVRQSCTETEVQNLRYVDVNEALTDVIGICRDLVTAGTSSIFGPVLVGGAIHPPSHAKAACLEATAAATEKTLRYSIRQYRRVLDRIAAINVPFRKKQMLIDRAKRRYERGIAAAGARLDHDCGEGVFATIYGRSPTTHLANVSGQADCFGGAVYVQDAVVCGEPVCGNGIEEGLEECDDGNEFDGDGCASDCTARSCDSFDSTFELIEQAIFVNRGCTSAICHGAGAAGGLELSPGVAADALIDVPAATVPGFVRVDPGSKEDSLLWLNLAARTLPDQYSAPVRGMPLGAQPPLTEDELEALRIWIEDGGASTTGTVPGTAELLGGCVPAPEPLTIAPLAPPALDKGIQLHMPTYAIEAQSEVEVCFSSYYDVSEQIPAEFLTADGQRFRYRRVDIRQNPLSHHLIVDLWRGRQAANDPVWGPYSCRGGARDGETCDPLDLGFCGDGDCATEPDREAIACIGFGPQQGLSTLTGGGFAFAQETASEFVYPDGVYDEIPVRGVVLWNSHAFNLTDKEGEMEAWVNIYFPEPEQQMHRQTQIFNVEKIFWTLDPFSLNFPRVAAFQQREFCHVHTFRTPFDPPATFEEPVMGEGDTLRLFELSGHMHRHGKRFQIYAGEFLCDGGLSNGQACNPGNPDTCVGGSCVETTGRDAESSLLYTSLVYNDPVVLRFEEPMTFHGSQSMPERSLTYCALYDNGVPPNEHEVKRRSTSPPAGTLFGFPVGGPCSASLTRCIGGPHHDTACRGDDRACDSSPGAGDGDCDACPLAGGFRTEDEMFILFGNFWVE